MPLGHRGDPAQQAGRGQCRERAAERAQEGEEHRARVDVDHAALPAAGEHGRHEEQHDHEDDEQQNPLDPPGQPPAQGGALPQPARGAAHDGRDAAEQRDDRPQGHRAVVRGRDGAETAALDGDVHAVDDGDRHDAPAEPAHHATRGLHLEHGQDDDGEAEQQQVQPVAGDGERVDEEVERGLVGVRAVVQHERGPRQVRADDRQHAARDAQRRGGGRQPGDHARTRSVSPKKPCGRNTSTTMSTTKIQT